MTTHGRVLPAVVICLAGLMLAAAPSDRQRFAVLEKLEASSVPVMIKFPKATLPEVLGLLSQAGGFTVEWKGSESKESLSLNWENLTVKEALVRLGQQQDLVFEVPAKEKLVVIPARRSGGGK